jgi:hypothetical protein
LLLISDDSGNFSFSGVYTYTVEGNEIVFSATCEGSLPRYRAFPAEATFTATSRSLELFDATRGVHAVYTLIQ